jgi:hypothetical protein
LGKVDLTIEEQMRVVRYIEESKQVYDNYADTCEKEFIP